MKAHGTFSYRSNSSLQAAQHPRKKMHQVSKGMDVLIFVCYFYVFTLFPAWIKGITTTILPIKIKTKKHPAFQNHTPAKPYLSSLFTMLSTGSTDRMPYTSRTSLTLQLSQLSYTCHRERSFVLEVSQSIQCAKELKTISNTIQSI